MKRALWLGVLFLSASWLFLIPQFTIPDVFIGVFFLSIGTLCIIGGLSRLPHIQCDVRYTLLVFPIAFALCFVPFPYNLGLIVLGIGLLAFMLSYKWKVVQTAALGILLSGILLLLQTIVFPFYVFVVSHGHRVDLLTPLISSLANFLGFHTSVNNNLLFLQTLQQVSPVSITWEKLGADFFLYMLLGALVLFVLFSKKRLILKNIIILLITMGVYAILRFLGILALYASTTDLSMFWNPLLMTLSFLPFALLLMKLLPFQDNVEAVIHEPTIGRKKKRMVALVLLFLLMSAVLGGFLYQDPGSMKKGRILIDEFHSEWEDTLRPMDTTWYGQLSTYNYYSWAQWLGYYYIVEKNTNESLTQDLLANYDILILKCPTESYTTLEIQAIKDFVSKGGGCYLIGDHTNVFGMNTFLNQIAEEFGFRFNTDATYELGTGNLSIFIPDRFYSHAIMRHVTQFEFMTSCTLEPTSLEASLRIEPIIVGNRIISEPGTYSTENFFRESVSSPDSEYGYLLQAAAIKQGAGRVVAFTDSTVFSSFSMFTDGYPTFTLGVLQYLNRTNTSPSLNLMCFVLAIILFISVSVLLKSERKITILWMVLVTGLLAFPTTASLCSYLVDSAYPLPSALTNYTQVCFDQQHSSMNIFLKPTASLGREANNYGTFFVWTQRLGLVPSIEPSLNDAARNGDVIVIINPSVLFTETEVNLLTGFLERGGHLLLMDSVRNTASTANDLLGGFGIWIATSTEDQQLWYNESINESQKPTGNITTPYLTITGGTTLLINDKNEVYAAMVEFQNDTTGAIGKLVVAVDSYTFCDAVMGGTFTEPTASQRRIYDTEFFLFNEMIKS